MNTKITRRSIGILFLMLLLQQFWIVTAGSVAGTAQSASQSEPAKPEDLRPLLKARYEIAASLLEIDEKKLNEVNLGGLC